MTIDECDLTDLIIRAPHLEYADLRNNNLTEIVPSLFTSTGLQRLDLECNPLTGVSQEITRFSSLISLDIRKTPVTSMPTGFFKMTQVKQLWSKDTTFIKEFPEKCVVVLGEKKMFSLMELSADAVPADCGRTESIPLDIKEYLENCEKRCYCWIEIIKEIVIRHKLFTRIQYLVCKSCFKEKRYGGESKLRRRRIKRIIKLIDGDFY